MSKGLTLSFFLPSSHTGNLWQKLRELLYSSGLSCYRDCGASLLVSRTTQVFRSSHKRGLNVNGSRYYRALESVSIASALSTALTIYPCQIRVHQRRQSKLQLLTARKKERWPATADSLPQAVTCQHCDRHYFSRPRTHNRPIVGPTRYQ